LPNSTNATPFCGCSWARAR